MPNELYHYGIKGMKWGVRRTEAQLARARGEQWNPLKKKTASTKTSSSSSGEKKKVSEMSDDELRRAVNRLQLEKQYRDLSPKSVSRGKRLFDTAMKQVAIPAVTNASRSVLTDYIERELRKSTGLLPKGGDKKKDK